MNLGQLIRTFVTRVPYRAICLPEGGIQGDVAAKVALIFLEGGAQFPIEI